MDRELEEVAAKWSELGGEDPMWAALTEHSEDWSSSDFLRAGAAEIERALDLVRRFGFDVATGRALDFGCGPGRLTAGLAAAGFDHAVGVDVSPTMLARARELVSDERCEFRLNSAPDLSQLDSGSFDLVYCCRVLQHMPPGLAHGYIREFLRVARPGAPVLFQLPARLAPTVVGMLMRCAPRSILDRVRKGMQMHATDPASVVRLVGASSGVTVTIEPDASAGPRWESFLYVVRREGDGPHGLTR